MLGANGGPTISPHNPLWLPFTIDPVHSPCRQRPKGGENHQRQCVRRLKKGNSSKGEPFGFTLLLLQTTIMGGQSCPDQ